jgi:hypothetical protein
VLSNTVHADIVEFNKFRRQLLQDEHNEKMRLLQEKHDWKRQQHDVKMSIRLMHQQQLHYSVNRYANSSYYTPSSNNQ